jgi:hypothetical protein
VGILRLLPPTIVIALTASLLLPEQRRHKVVHCCMHTLTIRLIDESKTSNVSERCKKQAW